jgi:hypothetical protein
VSLELFQLHRAGSGPVPQGFEDVYLCDLLHLSYTELAAQPDW